MSTVKKHPVASTLFPVSVISLACIGGCFKFFRKGGEPHQKAKTTIDAMNKLTVEDKNIKKFISDLGGLGDNTVRVVVEFLPEARFEQWCNCANASTQNFNDAKMIITTIITDALNNPNTEQSSTSIFKYEDRSNNIGGTGFKNYAWLRMLRGSSFGDNKNYLIWFGMDKNNEDLHIKIDLTMGWAP